MQHRADFELARRAAQADRAGFGALFEDWFGRVHAFVQRRTTSREAAESTTERILARAFAQLAGYDGNTPFSAWLLAIVKAELRASESRSRAPLSGGTPLSGPGA